MDSMKMQIKELERTHSLESAKSLEKVKELQSSIENIKKEKNAAVEKLKSESNKITLLNKHIEIKDFEIEHQAAVDSLNKNNSSNKERFEINLSAELDFIKKGEQLLKLEQEKNKNLKKEVGSRILGLQYIP
jgi:hypothetical protein